MPDIQQLRETLQAYTGDTESLNRFTTMATEVLGADWAQHIFDDLADLPPDEQEKLNHAFQYYAALTAWEEIQAYLSQTEPLNPEVITERIPVLSHWLSFFGEPGEDAVKQLSEKLSTQTATPPVDTSLSDAEIPMPEQTATEEMPTTQPVDETEPEKAFESESEPTPVVEQAETPVERESTATPTQKSEPIWLVEKVFRQMELTQNVQAWITARCIALGNIEIFAYPYYGFLVDLMKQTLADIQSLLSEESLFDDIESSYEDGIKRLQNMQISLERDLEIAEQNGVSEETNLIRDNLGREDVLRALGRLDTSNQPEYLGPAPDGFEPLVDPYTELDEKPIKEEYSKIENVVLSEEARHILQNAIKESENEKMSSQTPENGVKRKLSFSLGNKPKPTVG